MSILNLGYQLTALQQAVIDHTRNFDTDAKMRYNLFAYSQSHTVYPLDLEDMDGLPAQFKFLGSSIWLREATRGYLLYLEYFLELIRGGHQPAFVLSADIPRVAIMEELQSEWLQAHRFREALEGLMTALQETLDHFNAQIVCHLVRNTLFRTQHLGAEAWKPSFDKGLPWKEARLQLDQFEDIVYSRAKSLYQGGCGRAHETMRVIGSAHPHLLRLVSFSQSQLMLIAASNRGGDGVGAEAVLAMDPRIPDPVHPWRKRESGLIVPGTLQ